jgi:hypothetical protein
MLQFENKFYQRKEGMAVGNSLSPVVSNIFLESTEEMALDTAGTNPLKGSGIWIDTFVVWPHGTQDCSNFSNTSTTLGLPSSSQRKLKMIVFLHS